jgi:hypothetical protein
MIMRVWHGWTRRVPFKVRENAQVIDGLHGLDEKHSLNE